MSSSFYNRFLTLTAILGAAGVMAGAFGAHFLKSRLESQDLETLKTGVLYLFVHVLASLLICALSPVAGTSRWLKSAGVLFSTGILLFSGSLFLIATESLTGFPARAIGWVTPLGGLCFIAGWVCLACFGARRSA